MDCNAKPGPGSTVVFGDSGTKMIQQFLKYTVLKIWKIWLLPSVFSPF
jgi:hypothetical protein